MNAPDPALVARFRRAFGTVSGRAPGANERIALAVSGGPDSMAMLALAAAAFPGQVVAATVDHGLRPESADEAAMVAGYCAEIGVTHAILRITIPPEASDNLQSWARQERYALLRRWAVEAGAATLATAHHADDQAETFLMRAARGSGLSGLAAIRARQEIRVGAAVLAIVRPLLDWRGVALRAVAEAAAIPFVDDPSNADDRFDRTRFRALLRAAPWIDSGLVARAAAHLAEADAELRALIDLLWDERALVRGGAIELSIAGLPREARRRLARRSIAAVRADTASEAPDWSDATNIEPLLDSLEAGKSATQAGVMASAKGDIWHFREAPARRSH
uniref:tRNA lysidine(34) synthetase TilS n=1 Tax=Sphingomonas bacterium TaxID=1895847 RepID=UPI0026339CF5|nr:tRNA lysidine(34) synthetase TilS [Sphingomonas bacterium]